MTSGHGLRIRYRMGIGVSGQRPQVQISARRVKVEVKNPRGGHTNAESHSVSMPTPHTQTVCVLLGNAILGGHQK
jgi:hypothetical protein